MIMVENYHCRMIALLQHFTFAEPEVDEINKLEFPITMLIYLGSLHKIIHVLFLREKEKVQ